MKKTKKKNAQSGTPLRVISIGGYGSKIKSIPVPKYDGPKDDKLYVIAVGGYDSKMEKIYLPGNRRRYIPKTDDVKVNEYGHIIKRK
jgi:hypothetical protein